MVSKPDVQWEFIARYDSDPLDAWLLNYRRLTNRWERHAINFLGFVRFGCISILLRHY